MFFFLAYFTLYNRFQFHLPLLKEWRGWPRQKWCSLVGVSGDEGKIQWCKEQYYIETWNVRFISSVQKLSHVWLFATPWTRACQAFMSITNSQSLLKFMSIKSVMPSNHPILCSLLILPSIFPSIKVFSNESVLCITWPKYCNFSFSISPTNDY